MRSRTWTVGISTICLFVALGVSEALYASPQLGSLTLPKGFKIATYSADVPGARSMALGADGTLFVGTRDDRIYGIRDTDGDYVADEVRVLAKKLNMPNGVAIYGDDLYVAEIDRILVWRGWGKKLGPKKKPVVLAKQFPKDRHHGWKFIAFGPDGKLYVPVGAPCNICEPDDPYAAITRMNPDGSGFEVIARGVRNTVGFDWHPKTGELWFTDNGRDMLGDDVPPCELNRMTQPKQHFGYPYCHGADVMDPEFGDKRACKDITPPVLNIQAHSAPLGIRFYEGKMFPEPYQGQIFMAEHGSWNRSKKVGYKVSVVSLDAKGKVKSYSPFIYGFLDEKSQEDWGRPVDVQALPDGSLLVSDDKQGAIYRVSYLDISGIK